MYYHLRDIRGLFGLQLAEAFRAIPFGVTTLVLSWNFLYKKTGAELATAFSGIRNSVTTLDLSWNSLCEKPGAELATVFASIPSSVTTLNLSSNALYLKSTDELATAFAGILTSVTTLNLSWNFLHAKLGSDLARVFSAIPRSVTTLDLSVNDLSLSRAAELATAFAGIPISVTTLDLTHNDFKKKSGAELATAFAGIPMGVTTLNLSENGFHEKSGTELAIAFSGIPSSVTTLDLTRNDFQKKSGAELATAFAGIPMGVTTLNLSENGFHAKSGNELAIAFSGIPSSVTTLDLTRNDFQKKSGAELATAFAGIPMSVTTLNLSENGFYEKSGTELAIAFSSIPNNVTTLNFGRDFSMASVAQIKELLLSLPASITTIIVNDVAYQPDAYLLEQLFPLESREIYHFAEVTIKPAFEIDEVMLVRLITYIQNHPSPLGYLVCGLLLEGAIENTYEDRDKSNEHYVESRGLAAISFYRKAACDVALKDKIEHRVWKWRTLLEDGDSSAIREVLNQYKLTPGFSYYNIFKQDDRVDLLDFADNTQNPFPHIESVFPAEPPPLPHVSCWLLLKIGFAAALGVSALLALCVLKVPVIVASIGVGVVAAGAYAAYRFFGQPQQNMEDSTAHGLALTSLNARS